MSIKNMIRKSLGFITRSALMLAALVLGASTALAGNLTWNTTTGAWDINTTANWTGDATKFNNGDAVTFNNTSGGTVTIATGGVLPGSTTVSAASGTYTITGAALGGTGSLTKSAAGALTLSGANTYSGGTTVSAGSLTIGIASTKSGTTTATGSTGIGNVTLADGVILPNTGNTWYAPKVTLQGDITLEGTTRQAVGFATLDLNNGSRTIYVNPTGGNIKQTIPGNTALEGTGRSRWEMGADVGALTVQNGTLILASNLTGNDYAGFMFRDSGASFAGNLGLTVGPNVFLQTNNGNGLGSTTANSTKLIVNGIWGLLGTGGASKDQTIYSLAGSGRVYASVSSANVNSRTITINGTAGSTEFSGELSNGAGTAPLSIVKNGASTQIFSGTNSYTGSTTISGGTLILGNTKALGFGGLIAATFTGTTTVNSGYTLDLNGVTDISEPITLNGTGIDGNGALVNNSVPPASMGSGIAAVRVASAGSGYSAVPAVNFSGTGTGAAATASLGVTAASFGITSGGAYSTKPTAAISGGGGSGATVTLNWSGSSPNFTITGIAIASAGTGFTSAPTITLSGGVGTAAVLTSNANNFCVVGVAMTAAGSGYTGTPTYTFGSGNATPGTVTLSSVNLASASSIGGSGDITIGAVISGANALTKVGAGTLTLAATNTYSGATTISAGTLALGASGALNVASSVSITSGATFDVSGLGDSAMYTLGSSAGLTASGTGTTVGTSAAAIKGGSSGIVSLGSRPITLTYDGTHPALYVSQGTLSLNGNAFTVNSASPLADGIYTIAQQASGDITTAGSYPAATGTAIASGKIATISISGANVILTILTGVDHFAISPISSPQTAGTEITGITITAQNSGNATVSSFTGTVTFGGTAGVTGTSVNFIAGVLSGLSVTPKVAGTGKTFTVSDGVHTGSVTIATINPSTPAKLAFTTQPNGGTAGTAWDTQPAVTVQDAYGNTVTDGSSSIALAIAASTPTSGGPGTLSGTTPVSSSSGVATFSGVSIDKVGIGYKLTATSEGLSATNSAAFNITPGAAASLTVAGFPNPQPKGQSGNVTVTAKDIYGNIATNYTGTVTLTSNDGAATLPSPHTFTSANAGVYSFSVTLNTMGTKSITAGDGTLTDTQSGIVITKVPDKMTFSTPGTYTWTAPGGVTSINLLVVAGGGGAGLGGGAGGGGAGGLIYYGSESPNAGASYAVTPGTTYTITVGAGGSVLTNGQNSSFDTVTALGGGYGGSQWAYGDGTGYAGTGGSGGGGGQYFWNNRAGGSGTTGQGYNGGANISGGQAASAGGGGGGAGMVGYAGHTLPATGTKGQPGNGGDGLTFSISGASVTYAGGGGGAFFGDTPYTGLVQGVGGAGHLNAGGGGTAVHPSGSTAGQNGIVIMSYTLPPQGTMVSFF